MSIDYTPYLYHPQVGDTITGAILSEDKQGLWISSSSKYDLRIPWGSMDELVRDWNRSDWLRLDPDGTNIGAVIVGWDSERECWIGSQTKYQEISRWKQIEDQIAEQGHVHAGSIKATGKGVECLVNEVLRAYIPQRHVGDILQHENRDPGWSYACKVLKHERRTNGSYSIVLSRKEFLIEQRAIEERERERIFYALDGQLQAGVNPTASLRIASVQPYGYFCTFGSGLHGLLHSREFTRECEGLGVGDVVEVMVTDTRRKGEKMEIDLSARRRYEDMEWSELRRKGLGLGTSCGVRVLRSLRSGDGLIVGIDGYEYVSGLIPAKSCARAVDTYTKGEHLIVEVLALSVNDRRIRFKEFSL